VDASASREPPGREPTTAGGLALLRFIEDEPGLSGWELSQASGMPYPEATRGLEKLRERGVVKTKAEERAEVGFRYRYWPAEDPTVRAHFVEVVRDVESLNAAA
jgi:DNA-binding transcriptional ArsR family regulator